jgi:hypothetical protein
MDSGIPFTDSEGGWARAKGLKGHTSLLAHTHSTQKDVVTQALACPSGSNGNKPPVSPPAGLQGGACSLIKYKNWRGAEAASAV